MTCSATDCERSGKMTRGMCRAHYQRWKKSHADQLRPVMRGASPLERVMARVDKTDSCWLFRGLLTKSGYGQIGRRDGGTSRAHRIVYEALVGPIPIGLVLDHLCRVKHCVNPEHLEAVTQQENVRRGTAPTAINAAKTHCIRGHELTAENTRPTPTGRQCRACERRSVPCPECGKGITQSNLRRHRRNLHAIVAMAAMPAPEFDGEDHL